MKIVIGDDSPDEPDMSIIPAKLRDVPDLVPGAVAAVKDKSIPTFELQRGSSNADPETEWLINGQQFEADQAADLRQARTRRGVWRDPQRRRRLGAPDAPPHGGAPGRRPQRQARRRRRATPTTAARRT